VPEHASPDYRDNAIHAHQREPADCPPRRPLIRSQSIALCLDRYTTRPLQLAMIRTATATRRAIPASSGKQLNHGNPDGAFLICGTCLEPERICYRSAEGQREHGDARVRGRGRAKGDQDQR
jgi:hypothetical protein